MWQRLGKGGARYWGKRGAGIMFTDGRAVLLLKRGDKGDFAGYWSVPGGKVEEGETFLGGAQRETREETGHLPNCTRIATFDNQDGRFVFKTFLCRVNKPYEVKLSDEHTDFRWVPLADLANMKLHPKLKEIMPSILRTIRQRIGGELQESVTYTGAEMNIGRFRIWEMEKYLDEHRGDGTRLDEGLFGKGGVIDQAKNALLDPVKTAFGLKAPATPAPTPLGARTVHPELRSFMGHIMSELDLPHTPAVEKALENIVSRAAPEPYGTGGMLRLDWFRVICDAVYKDAAAKAGAPAPGGGSGTPKPPTSGGTPALDMSMIAHLPGRNPIQILQAIRSIMPAEKFHSKVTLEGGAGKNGDEHDAHFLDMAQRMERELGLKYGFRTRKTPAPVPTPTPTPSPGPGPGPGGKGKGKISGVPPEMLKIIRAMPKAAWMDATGIKHPGDLAAMLNTIATMAGITGFSPDGRTYPELNAYIASMP